MANAKKKAKKSTKGKGGAGAGTAPKCDPNDVCDWVTGMAPTGKLGAHPPGEPMPQRPAGRAPWLQDMWECYAELYTAVAHLEKVVFCKDATITDPFIVNCPGGGGGPTKGGTPPPPPFP